jgi:hypothetical protein
VLEIDEDAFLALKTFTGYQPNNPAHALAAVTTAYEAQRAAQEAEVLAKNALEAARDTAILAEWDFHNLMLDVKAQVQGIYGSDSDQFAAMGLKKKSTRKTRTHSTSPAPTE